MQLTNLTGFTLEQIVKVLDEANTQYSSFTLTNKRNATVATHSSTGAGISCDNYKGPHYALERKQPRNGDSICQNRQAINRNSRGGGDRQ